ncbi:MAG: protein kinase, partial [Anaerolineaceae bacterium]|nr:protein kinase [Anaerolineaceae bacterium]
MKKNYCYSCMRELPEGQSICSYCGNDNRIPHNESIQLPEGTVLNGKYMAGHMLGLGGFGITYIAIDLKMGIRVAIKEFFPRGIITRDVNTRQILVTNKAVNLQNFHKGIEAFQVEAQNIGKFDSPSIVHVRDFFLENNTAYIVMDYAEGPSLAQEIKHCGGQMEWDRVVGLMKPLIRAMDQLHRKNLIHRDIKPENIKVVTDPETGEERLVLLDFGAARSFASQNITKTYTQILTPGYAPYEQYLVRTHLGPFTDIYALCATMYAAITGEKPPAAPDRMVGADDIKPFSSYGLDVPEYVEKAIAHGLEKLYKNRTQTMRELLNELQEEIPEEPRDTDSILNDFSSNPLITGTGTGTGNNTSFDGGAEIWAASAENAVPVPIPEETLTGNTARIPEKNEISQENTIQPKLMSRKILLILIVSAVLAAGVFLIYRINSSHSETSELTKEISSESSLIDTGIPETPAAEILAAANTPEQTATTAETSVPSNTPEPTATLTETPAPSDTPEPTASTTETSAPSNTPEPTATTTDTPTHAVTEAPRDITMTTFKGIVNNPYDKSEKAGEMLYQQPSLKGTPLRSVI